MTDVGQDPLTDLKRRTTVGSVVLTLNGRPEIVVLDAPAYQRLMDELPQRKQVQV